MKVNVLMEIDPDKGQMWIRLYDQDAETLRDLLVPGSRVAIHGTISVYESSGGYAESDFRGALQPAVDVVRKDRFQLSGGSLELVVGTMEGIDTMEGKHDER